MSSFNNSQEAKLGEDYSLKRSAEESEDERKPPAKKQKPNRVIDLTESPDDKPEAAVISLLNSDDDEDDQHRKLPARETNRLRRRHSLPASSPVQRDAVRPSQKIRRRNSLPPTPNDNYQHPQFPETAQFELNASHKSHNFNVARKPEKRLKEDLKQLQGQLDTIIRNQPNYRQTTEYKLCISQIKLVRDELDVAQQNAAHDIFHQNNSTRTMGMDNSGILVIDLHGLYVKEAIQKFNDTVLPILPVQKTIQLITGKGKHSKNKSNKGALKTGLLDYIQTTREYKKNRIRCQVLKRNEGVLTIEWVGE